MNEGKKIILTGAAGAVAQPVIEVLQDKYSLKLFDRLTCSKHLIQKLDIRKKRAVLHKIKDADILIHLAAIPEEDEPDKIFQHNITGTFNIFEAARINGIKRVICASSLQTYGDPKFYPNELLSPNQYNSPHTNYAISKLYAENLGKVYSTRYGLSVICIRLGWYPRKKSSEKSLCRLSYRLLSPNDCKRLFLSCVETNEMSYAIINGVSRSGEHTFNLEPGRRLLGFEPQDLEDSAIEQHQQRFQTLRLK